MCHHQTKLRIRRGLTHWLTRNLKVMVDIMRAQFPKYDVRAIVIIKRSLMPLKDIGRRACLWTKISFELLMILGLEGAQKFQKRLNLTMKKNLKELGVDNKRSGMDFDQNKCFKNVLKEIPLVAWLTNYNWIHEIQIRFKNFK